MFNDLKGQAMNKRRGFMPRQLTEKSAAGLRAQRQGKTAEEQILEIGAFYLQHGIAELCKRHEPYKRVGSGKNCFHAVYSEKAGCDFEIWLPSGKAGYLECKSREGLRIQKSAIDPYQWEQLDRRVSWGQIAVVLVRLDNKWFICPWIKFRDYEKKSFTEADLLAVGKPIPMLANLLPDFIKVLDQI